MIQGRREELSKRKLQLQCVLVVSFEGPFVLQSAGDILKHAFIKVESAEEDSAEEDSAEEEY